MQVTETLNEGLKRGYSITVPATELEAKVSEKLEEARKDFQMKGFRKGKAPGRADEEDVRQVGARRGDAGVDRRRDARALRDDRRPPGARSPRSR